MCARVLVLKFTVFVFLQYCMCNSQLDNTSGEVRLSKRLDINLRGDFSTCTDWFKTDVFIRNTSVKHVKMVPGFI